MKEGPLTLGQVLERIPNYQRVLVVYENGQVCYKGWKGNFDDCDGHNANAQVKEISLAEEHLTKEGKDLKKVPPINVLQENEKKLTLEKLADIEVRIYQRIILRNEQKNS